VAPTAIYTEQFRSFVVPGGSGATLPLAFYFTRSKSERLRRVGWLGIWPGIFNINEPSPSVHPSSSTPSWRSHSLSSPPERFGCLPGHRRRIGNAHLHCRPWTLPSPLLMFLETGYDWRAIILAIVTEFVIPASSGTARSKPGRNRFSKKKKQQSRNSRFLVS
jgi:PTS system cellobiose-specific IIC component